MFPNRLEELELEVKVISMIENVLDESIEKNIQLPDMCEKITQKNLSSTCFAFDCPKQFLISSLDLFTTEALMNVITSKEGSLLLQNSISSAKATTIANIFAKIKDKILTLMIHSFGNYFVQVLFNFLSSQDRILLLSELKSSFFIIVNHPIGLFPILSLISQADRRQEKSLLALILMNHSKSVTTLCMSSNCRQVIEKLLDFFDSSLLTGFVKNINPMLYEIATKKKYQFILVKIIHNQQNEEILNLITRNFKNLVNHPHGNFIVATAIKEWSVEFLMPMFHQFIGQFYELSMYKYSSIIVERCIQKSDKMLAIYIDEMLFINKFPLMIKSLYANYTIKTALNLAPDMYRLKLVKAIVNNISQIGEISLMIKWKNICFKIIEDILLFNNSNVGNNYFAEGNGNERENYYLL